MYKKKNVIIWRIKNSETFLNTEMLHDTVKNEKKIFQVLDCLPFLPKTTWF